MIRAISCYFSNSKWQIKFSVEFSFLLSGSVCSMCVLSLKEMIQLIQVTVVSKKIVIIFVKSYAISYPVLLLKGGRKKCCVRLLSPFFLNKLMGSYKNSFLVLPLLISRVLEYSQMLIGLYNRAESRKKYFVHF